MTGSGGPPASAPTTLGGVFETAVALAEGGRTEEAESMLLEALKQMPDQPELLRALGYARILAEDWPGAATALRKAVALRPEHPRNLTLLALALREAGAPGEAAEICAKATALTPKDGEAWFHLGVAALHAGDHARAASAFSALVPLAEGPFTALAQRLDRLARLLGLGTTEVAVALGDRAVKLPLTGADPEVEAHWAAGELHDADLLARVADAVPQRRLAIDAGAGLGNHAVAMAQGWGMAKVLAFEGHPAGVQALRRIQELNALPGLELRHLGTLPGRRAGRAGYPDRRVLSGRAQPVKAGATPQDLLLVPVRPLDQMLADVQAEAGPIDLIRVAVPGWEAETIAGAKALIERDRPALWVAVRNATVQPVLEQLEPIGYVAEVIADMGAKAELLLKQRPAA